MVLRLTRWVWLSEVGVQPLNAAHLLVDQQAKHEAKARTGQIYTVHGQAVDHLAQLADPLDSGKQLDPAGVIDVEELFDLLVDARTDQFAFLIIEWMHGSSFLNL